MLGLFKNEIIPIVVKGKGADRIIDEDEEFRNVDFTKIPKLKPVFEKNGKCCSWGFIQYINRDYYCCQCFYS